MLVATNFNVLVGLVAQLTMFTMFYFFLSSTELLDSIRKHCKLCVVVLYVTVRAGDAESLKM